MPAKTPHLTEREQDIASLVATGMTNAQIAGQLGIAEQTVRHTLTRVFRKAGVANRTALARAIIAPSRRPRARMLSAIFLIVSLLAGCSSQAPTAPSTPADVAGRWSGNGSVDRCSAVGPVGSVYCTFVPAQTQVRVTVSLSSSGQSGVTGTMTLGQTLFSTEVTGPVSGRFENGRLTLTGRIGTGTTYFLSAWDTRLSTNGGRTVLSGEFEYAVTDAQTQGSATVRISKLEMSR